MENLKIIGEEAIYQNNDYAELISKLQLAFSSPEFTIPERLHYHYPSTKSSKENTLLVMPGWDNNTMNGIKLLTIHPENSLKNIATIQGIFILFDRDTGSPKAIFDAKSLTNIRTAATSALASSYLSNPSSKTLLVIGSGALVPSLIKAHSTVRDIKTIYLWSRDINKTVTLIENNPDLHNNIIPLKEISEGIAKADIITSATSSQTPLIKGALLQNGQHIDLVGSYKKDMREADDSVIKKASIFIDTANAYLESGDLFTPMSSGLISKNDIQADLHNLCSNTHVGRLKKDEITLFKSVGYAIEDLVAANYIYEKLYHE